MDLVVHPDVPAHCVGGKPQRPSPSPSPSSSPSSPRPSEPDVHLRFLWANQVFDCRGCRTAVQNFLRKWSDGHNPAITAVELPGGFLPDNRMPCEELWL